MAVTVTLPPTIKPGRTLPELKQAIDVWTRQAQTTIKDIAANAGGNVSIPDANATTTGLLTAADWVIFNSKQPAGSYLTDAPADGSTYGRKNNAWVAVTSPSTGNLTEATSSVLTITGGTGAVIGAGTTIQVKQANGSQSGFLSSSDWTTFNGKQSALTFGNVTEATSSVLTITGGTGAVVGSGLSIQVKLASGSQSGYLSSSDWTTFNGKQSALTFGNLTEVTSSVLTITGGTGAVIGSGSSIQVKQANGSQSGYLSSSDWTTFNGKLSATKGTKAVVLCAAFTPALSGADTGEVPMPYATDGTTSLTYNITRIVFRVGVAGGAPAVTIEKSTSGSGFTPTTVGTVTLGTGAFEGNTTSSLGTINSGEKLRFNVTTLATAQYWTVVVEIAPQ